MSKIIFYPFVSMIFLARRAGKLHPAPSSAAHGIRFLKAHPMEFFGSVCCRRRNQMRHTHSTQPTTKNKKERKKGHIPFVICGKIFSFFFFPFCAIAVYILPYLPSTIALYCLFVCLLLAE
jgi:hypothetical protein